MSLNGSPDVLADQVEQLTCRWREPHDIELAVQKQRCNARTGQQVVQIIRQPPFIFDLLLKLGVKRRQLFVKRLQLFLGGLQLFVCRLELLVHRHGFFVDGLQLFCGQVHSRGSLCVNQHAWFQAPAPADGSRLRSVHPGWNNRSHWLVSEGHQNNLASSSVTGCTWMVTPTLSPPCVIVARFAWPSSLASAPSEWRCSTRARSPCRAMANRSRLVSPDGTLRYLSVGALKIQRFGLGVNQNGCRGVVLHQKALAQLRQLVASGLELRCALAQDRALAYRGVAQSGNQTRGCACVPTRL